MSTLPGIVKEMSKKDQKSWKELYKLFVGEQDYLHDLYKIKVGTKHSAKYFRDVVALNLACLAVWQMTSHWPKDTSL